MFKMVKHGFQFNCMKSWKKIIFRQRDSNQWPPVTQKSSTNPLHQKCMIYKTQIFSNSAHSGTAAPSKMHPTMATATPIWMWQKQQKIRKWKRIDWKAIGPEIHSLWQIAAKMAEHHVLDGQKWAEIFAAQQGWCAWLIHGMFFLIIF